MALLHRTPLRFLSTFALISLSLGSLLLTPASPPGGGHGSPPLAPYVPGEVLIKFDRTADPSDRASARTQVAAQRLHRFHSGAEHWKLGPGVSTETALQRLKGNPHVLYVEPNYRVGIDRVPNDLRYPEMYALNNSGQTGGTPGADIDAERAWGVSTGSRNVLVAIIDTGIDYTHPDLAANIWTNPGEIPGNGLDDDGNGFIDDIHGWDFINHDNNPFDDHFHGTHVAGTIGAVGNNSLGVVGVSWQVSLVALKFLGADGSGNTADAVAAIDYGTALGVDIMSNSWGGGGFSQTLLDSINAAGAADVLFVAAAGNSGLNTDLYPMYPAAYPAPNIVSVAATDHNDRLAGFSNFGPTTVDLGAPGVDILSTLPGASYGLLSGTSMATPHVSGAAALIRSMAPGIGVAELKNVLLAQADRIPALAGITVSGGRLNAFLPIATPDTDPPGSIGDLSSVGATGSSVTLQWTATGDDGVDGTASGYDIRYSTTFLDETNFATAERAAGPPNPVPSGSVEEAQVGGLDFNTTYFFAVKAKDEFGNAGPISNIASATTLGPPHFELTPSSLSADLLTGATALRTVTVHNSGVSDLIFSVKAEGATVVPLGLPGPTIQPFPGTGVSANAGSGEPHTPESDAYAAGHVGRRPPLQSLETPPTHVNAGNLRVVILTSGASVSELQTLLRGFPDLTTVDVLSIQSSVPSLATLAGYDAAFVVINNLPSNPSGVGDVLADYVDSGGGLVMTLASFIPGWEITGRLRSGGYVPVVGIGGPIGSSSLGTFDALHPIMAGVTHASGDLIGDVSLAAGAQLVASWANGEPFVATKGVHVVAVNAFLADAGYWSGDVPQLLHNAVFWSRSAVTWLSAAPNSAVVPAGSSLDLAVTFDATSLDGGDYDASVVLDTNDPSTPRATVPAHLHVTGAADIDLSGASFDFGPVFIGGVASRTLRITNTGTDLLTITSLSVNDPNFLVSSAGFSLAPRERRDVVLEFRPQSAAPLSATLTIDSDDPDEASLLVPLQGVGLVPPVIGASPPDFAQTLFTGASAVQTLTIRNTGGSALDFQIAVRSAGAAAMQAPLAAGAAAADAPTVRTHGPSSSGPPGPGYAVQATGPSISDGARVLLIQDAAPWGTNANETVLTTNGISFDRITVSQLASTELRNYRLVIVPSDQTTSFYSTLSAGFSRLESFVSSGGILEFHAAGWGWQSGDASLVTLPGGMRINEYISDTNRVLDPSHPLVAGVPDPFTGNAASHAYFTSIPAGATAVASDDTLRPNLVVYRFGLGTVIAGGQTFEHGYANGYPAGTILRNMIPYAVSLTPVWVSVEPASGSVPPGGSLDITVRFDATGLDGGLYQSFLDLESNDPLTPLISAPVALTVIGAPDLRLSGEPVTLESRVAYFSDGASTVHSLPVTVAPAGSGTLEVIVDGDYDLPFEYATVTVEGSPLGTVGGQGLQCGPTSHIFTIGSDLLAALAADGNVGVVMQNTPDVNVFCDVNEHTVRLRYGGPADHLDFGELFVGLTKTMSLKLENSGTAPLQVQSIVTDSPAFTPSAATLTLAPRTSATLTITFAPSVVGDFEGNLLLSSNDPDLPNVSLSLTGAGVDPPVAALQPSSLQATLYTGNQETQSLFLANSGGSQLEFSASVVPRPNGGGTCVPTQAYVSEFSSGELSRVDLATGTVTHIASALSFPIGVAVNPLANNQVLVIERDSGELSSVDLSTGIVTRIASGLGFPFGLALSPSGQTAYTGELDSGRLMAVDLVSGTIHQIASGLSRPTDLAIDASGATAYVAEVDSGELSAVNLSTGQVLRVAGGLGQPHGIALDGSGTRVFVNDYAGQRILSVNLITGEVVPIAPGVPSPEGLALSPLGDTAYPTDFSGGRLLAVTLATGSFRSIATGLSGPADVALDAGAGCDGAFLTVSPVAGSVGPGGTQELHAHFDTGDLLGGDYGAELRIQTNDPAHPLLVVPADLTVIGVPDIAILGEEVLLESRQDYNVPSARTFHHLPVALPPVGGGTAELVAEGDYGDPSEMATLTMEGQSLGSAGATGVDCTAASQSFALSAQQLASFVADGQVDAEVQNSNDVDLFCGVNRHTVRLRYHTAGDHLDFGAIFVGTNRTLPLRLENLGTGVLHVSLASDLAQFVPSVSSLTIPPRSGKSISVLFTASQAQAYSGSLTLTSDDPDEGLLLVPLQGEGVLPPVVGVSPPSFSQTLRSGGSASQTLTIRNTGGSSLDFEIAVREAGAAMHTPPIAGAAAPPAPTVPAPSSSGPPDPGYVAQATGPWISGNARVLLIQDAAPWGSNANESILTSNGIPFDRIPLSQFPSTDLRNYRLVIVSSDQTTSFYASLRAQFSRLQSFVSSGGVLEFHAAGWGWQGGDASLVTLPGGMHINQYISGTNRVLDPSHPLVAGVPNPFTGGAASHAYFTFIPAGAAAVASDEFSRANLVVYRFGVGIVIAGCQTFEYGYSNGQDPGKILRNMIPYAHDQAPLWLSVVPQSGSVPPGGSLDVTVRFDTSTLPAGLYEAFLDLQSNDPVTPSLSLPASLTVFIDSDADGIGDPFDNCPQAYNPGQEDSDGDGPGDACDICTDPDQDGRGNPGLPASHCLTDNCPSIYNPNQEDADYDGRGDLCDVCPFDSLNDEDADGVCASSDNCPATFNPDQVDTDGDLVGDVCDNCRIVPNHLQEDGDADSVGDLCDLCPLAPDLPQQDADGDRVGDVCDNCPAVSNPGQENFNGDRSGDACQPTLSLSSIQQDGGSALEVRAIATDPQGDPLSGRFTLVPSSFVQLTLSDAFLDPNACEAGFHPDRVPLEGIGYANETLGEPFLFDQDVTLYCSDGAADFEMALGSCAAPTGTFDYFVPLTGLPLPFHVCVRRITDPSSLTEITVTSYDSHTLSMKSGEGGTFILPFTAWPPRNLPFIPAPEVGRSYRMTLTVTDGSTEPMQTEGIFLYQGESVLIVNNPPVALAAAPPAVECQGPSGASVVLDASGSSDPDSSPGSQDDIASFDWYRDFGLPTQTHLGSAPALPVTLPLGAHQLTLKTTDLLGETSLSTVAVGVMDTTPPALNCPAPPTVECTSPAGAVAPGLVATGTDTCSAVVTIQNSRGGGADASGAFALGSTPVTFTALDASGNMATCTSTVTIRDTTPPVIVASASPVQLWSPNHRLVPVQISLQASDLCSAIPPIALRSALSSEPDDAPGDGDGATTGDISGADVGIADGEVLLRAERSATGSGRTYSLVYEGIDTAGNIARNTVTVTVLHDLAGVADPLQLVLTPDGGSGKAHVSWGSIPGVAGFDLVTGDLGQVARMPNLLSLGTVTVLAAGTALTDFHEGPGVGLVPPVGHVVFYVIQTRGVDGLRGGYGSDSAPLPREPASCVGGCP